MPQPVRLVPLLAGDAEEVGRKEERRRGAALRADRPLPVSGPGWQDAISNPYFGSNSNIKMEMVDINIKMEMDDIKIIM